MTSIHNTRGNAALPTYITKLNVNVYRSNKLQEKLATGLSIKVD